MKPNYKKIDDIDVEVVNVTLTDQDRKEISLLLKHKRKVKPSLPKEARSIRADC